MSRLRSSSGRYSEGELADSPEYYTVPRKGMADDEISISLSEEDQNSDALDIKPPQHQASYQSRERGTRKRDREHSNRRGGASDRGQEHSRDRDRKSKESRYSSRDERKESEKSRRPASDSRERTRDSRKVDLRERLERDRRLRKGKDRAERDDRRNVDEVRKRHSDQHKEKRNERDKRPSDLEELEDIHIHHYRDREKTRDDRKKRRPIDQYEPVASSPESVSAYIHTVPDREEKEMEEREDEEVRNEEASSSSLESSDEGEASSTSSSSSNTDEGGASPEVKSKSNGKHRTPPSEVEDDDDDHPDLKHLKTNESMLTDGEEAVQLNQHEVTPSPSPIELKEQFPPYLPAIMGCRSVEEFECLNRIEEGTYGVVYRARDKKTDEVVALKRLKMEREKEGFPITSLREVSTLLKAQHPNIVTVREIVVGSNMDKIFVVMDYVEHDLKSLMETLKAQKTHFLPGEVKCLLQQLLRAVAHLHDNWILHRDLKTSNLLLSHRGILKVGDFGLAREYGSPLKAYTSIVVTLWYRAPELLLGAKEYSTPIDVWSVGCIFGELLTMEAIFQGKSELDQINKIFKDLGTPNENIWPGYSELPAIKKATFINSNVNNLRRRFSTRLSELGIDLLQKFLTYDPSKRITAEDALNHTYLKEPPLPIDPSIFPTWPAKSEQHGPRKAHSPKPPSGGRAYKQLGDNDDDVVDSNAGFTMGNAIMDRRIGAVGAGFSLKF